jgi:hypothetical protein
MAATPDRRPELLPQPQNWIEKTPPMASALLSHLNLHAEKYGQEPIRHPGLWDTIEDAAKSQFWPTSLLLMVRQGNKDGYGGDATGLVPRLIDKVDDPNQICSIIDAACTDRINQSEPHLREIITDLLLDKYTGRLAHSFSDAVRELDSIIHDVHESLNQYDGKGLTKAARKFRLDNQIRLVKISGYNYDAIAARLFDPEGFENNPLVSPFKLNPQLAKNGLVIGVKQLYLLPLMSNENLEILDRFTPKAFRSEEADPTDPKAPHFYARRLLRGGQPLFRAFIRVSHQIEQAEKQKNVSTFIHIYPNPQKPHDSAGD